jgi:hypothetical protein
VNFRKIFKFAKYLIIPILFWLYVNFLFGSLTDFVVSVSEMSQGGSAGGIEQIGVGFATTVSVTRPYLFGLIRLPIYMDGLDISGVHEFFFAIFWLLLLVFIVWDTIMLILGKRKNKNTQYSYSYRR